MPRTDRRQQAFTFAPGAPSPEPAPAPAASASPAPADDLDAALGRPAALTVQFALDPDSHDPSF
jgi:hypothetical protein